MPRVEIPKGSDGNFDRTAVETAFMESPYLDWTRFAEEQGWDAHTSRREFAVKTWQEAKKRKLAEAQGDILAGLLHERKYNWSQEILKTLDRYPKLIEKGSFIIEAKIHQYSEMYADYQEFKKKGVFFRKGRNGREVRIIHPFEQLGASELASLARSLKDISDAKRSSLMLDKWAVTKFDMTEEQMIEPVVDESAPKGLITVEGKNSITIQDMQRWFDEFADKPSVVHETSENATSNEVQKIEVPKIPAGLLDDFGQPVKNG